MWHMVALRRQMEGMGGSGESEMLRVRIWE